MNPPRPMVPVSGLLAPRSRRAAKAGPLLPAHVARLVGFAGLASFGALQWGRLVDPGAGAAMVGALAAAVAAGFALTVVARARPSARRRWAAGAVAALVLLLVACAGAGVPGHMLMPRGWDELARGIGDGLTAVTTITVPYRGDEVWTRTVLVLGGAALIGLGALLAFLPRRDGRFGYPTASAVALGTLYAGPVIQRHAHKPFASGLAFALLLALFLWLERVERRNAVPAAAIVAIAAFAGLVAAPRLDGARPLLDYENLAQSLSSSKSTTYTWNHSYGPLDWPRDGREVLRVRSSERSYWKAVNLTEFDGQRWLEDVRSAGTSADVAGIADRRWVQSIGVTIRALRSAEFVTAGTTLAIADDQRSTVRSAPGVVEATGKPLSRGESYRALVYVPQPTTRQMRSAGTRYPTSLHADYGFLRLPVTRPGFGTDDVTVPIPFWGGPAQALQPDIAATFAGSRYAGVYALAQRLKAGTSTPYAYMRAIERYLATGFAYSETPPPSRAPLADFLLRDKLGYCQQFSGAMALLLRMGGIPARVSAGFAPGVQDDRTKEWVVRDVDAHSWVEVYFPGIGWVTRDPTPAASPARSQTADLTPAAGDASVAIGGGAGSAPLGGNLANRGDASSPATTASDTRSSHTLLYLGGGALVLLAALLAVVLRRRRRGDRGEQDELAELRRALRRSGRPPEPQLTLASLAHRLDGTPAEGYVRTLAAARYGYAAARPTRDQRAALRRELAAGLGLRGRLRAWWALPPRLAGVRSRTT